MSELVIDFNINGAVKSLHMDGFDLAFLGEKRVVRQTDIIFATDTQKWDLVYLDDGKSFCNDSLTGFDSYEIARSHEVQWLNDCRLLGVAPTSEEGLDIMNGIRFLMVNNAKPKGPPNDLVKCTFGCEHHKSVFQQ